MHKVNPSISSASGLKDWQRADLPEAKNSESPEPVVTLSRCLSLLGRHGYKLLGFVSISVIATSIISSFLVPVYEATAKLDVDRQELTGGAGLNSPASAVPDFDRFLVAQINLIQSDLIFRPIAEKYHLADSKTNGNTNSNSAMPFENMKVRRPANTDLLLITYRSSDPNLAAEVSNAIALSYLEHAEEIRLRSFSEYERVLDNRLEKLSLEMNASNDALLKLRRYMKVISTGIGDVNLLSEQLMRLTDEYSFAQSNRIRNEVIYRKISHGTPEDEGAITRSRAALQYQDAMAHENALKNAIAQVKSEYDQIDTRSLEYQQLKQQVKAQGDMYDELLHLVIEANVNAAVRKNPFRLTNMAYPPSSPVYPNKAVNALLAFLFSTIFSVSLAFAIELTRSQHPGKQEPKTPLGDLTATTCGPLHSGIPTI